MDDRIAVCRVVPDKLYIGVLVDVGVCVKFSGDQIVQLFSIRGIRKSQASDRGVNAAACASSWRRICLGTLCLPLSGYEREPKL